MVRSVERGRGGWRAFGISVCGWMEVARLVCQKRDADASRIMSGRVNSAAMAKMKPMRRRWRGAGAVALRRLGRRRRWSLGIGIRRCARRRLKRGETAVTMLLGIPMLLGRKSDGQLFAMRDLCPHRGIPLSAGWFDGETVQCKYHGWRFEPCSGRCEEIPSLTTLDSLEPTKIYANAFPVAERDGYAWVYVPAAGARAGDGRGGAAAGAGAAEVWRRGIGPRI